jgi:DNA-binding NarL/FixJ family response regulator
MIRVFLADDHTIVRKGVKQILAEASDIIVCGEASTGHQVLQAMQEIGCDVLVLDIKMPGGGGLEVLQKLRKYVTGTLAERMASELSEEKPPVPHTKLSNREYQVMLMMASGKTINEIAAELTLSSKTIGTYRSRILVKLSLSNSFEIIRYAYQNDLIE